MAFAAILLVNVSCSRDEVTQPKALMKTELLLLMKEVLAPLASFFYERRFKFTRK